MCVKYPRREPSRNRAQLTRHTALRGPVLFLFALTHAEGGSERAELLRGLVRGRVFTRDGRLVASTAQEGMIRKRNR